VKPILMSYNMSQQSSMRIIPYYLMFRRNLKLSIKKIMLLKGTILKRIIKLIHRVPIFRESTKAAINRA